MEVVPRRMRPFSKSTTGSLFDLFLGRAHPNKVAGFYDAPLACFRRLRYSNIAPHALTFIENQFYIPNGVIGLFKVVGATMMFFTAMFAYFMTLKKEIHPIPPYSIEVPYTTTLTIASSVTNIRTTNSSPIPSRPCSLWTPEYLYGLEKTSEEEGEKIKLSAFPQAKLTRRTMNSDQEDDSENLELLSRIEHRDGLGFPNKDQELSKKIEKLLSHLTSTSGTKNVIDDEALSVNYLIGVKHEPKLKEKLEEPSKITTPKPKPKVKKELDMGIVKCGPICTRNGL
ncbi:hypothetical protein LguiB_031929 [Lonicera macranthoides]